MDVEELIQKMAQLWVDNGGNAEGLAWCWRDIQIAVSDLTAMAGPKGGDAVLAGPNRKV